MPWLAAAATVAAPIVGGMMGKDAASSAAKAAQDAQNRSAAALAGVELPDIEKMKLALEEYTRTGEYNPLVEQALQLDPSAFQNIQTDPRLSQYNMQALEQVARMSQPGLSQADLAGFELASRNAAAGEQSRQQQIIQSLAQRGQGGSGAEIAMRAISNQGAANRESSEGLDKAQKLAQIKMQALDSLSNMSMGLANQQYGQQRDLATNTDSRNQWNTINAQNINERNIQNKNLAQQQNLANLQRVADNNVNLRNQQQTTNKGLLQQNFNNQITKAGGVAQGQNQLANMYGQQAANTQAGYSQIGNAVGTGIGAYAQNKQNQDNFDRLYPKKVEG